MAISPKTIKELREKTGAGMMDCKRALVKADGNMEEAIRILRKKGIATARKKSVRAASEGLIHTVIGDGATKGALVEVNCETDFVARTDDFISFVDDLAKQVMNDAPAGEDDFLSSPSAGDPSHPVKEIIIQKVVRLGENLRFRRFTRFEGDLVGSYIHAGGKIGVLMELACESPDDASAPEVLEVVKDLCMQVAASAPRFVYRDEVTEEILNNEREIYRGQVLAQGKPEQIVEKIVTGKTNKFFGENCLFEQAFVKEPAIKVSDYIQKKVKARIKVLRFARYVLGEGLPSSECDSQ